MNHQRKQMKYPENDVDNYIWSLIITLVKHFKGFFKRKTYQLLKTNTTNIQTLLII